MSDSEWILIECAKEILVDHILKQLGSEAVLTAYRHVEVLLDEALETVT